MCVPKAQSFVAAMRERFELPVDGAEPDASAFENALTYDDRVLFWELCNRFLRECFPSFPKNLYVVFEFHVLTNGYALPKERFTCHEQLDLQIEEEWSFLWEKIKSGKAFSRLAKEHGDEIAFNRPPYTDAQHSDQKLKRVENEKSKLKTRAHRIKRKFYLKGRLPRGS